MQCAVLIAGGGFCPPHEGTAAEEESEHAAQEEASPCATRQAPTARATGVSASGICARRRAAATRTRGLEQDAAEERFERQRHVRFSWCGHHGQAWHGQENTFLRAF